MCPALFLTHSSVVNQSKKIRTLMDLTFLWKGERQTVHECRNKCVLSYQVATSNLRKNKAGKGRERDIRKTGGPSSRKPSRPKGCHLIMNLNAARSEL